MYVAAYHCSQPLNIEKGVLDLERVEGPFNEIHPAGKRELALLPFEPTPDSAVAIWRQYAQHVAMKIILATRLQARNAEAEGDHFVSIERTEDLTANLARHHEQARRKQLGIVKAPDLALQADRFGEFVQFRELMNFKLEIG